MLQHLDPLIEDSLVRNFAAGSTVLYQGEVPRHACILVRGVVKVMGISAQGDEQIVTYHVAGEFFPSTWIFNKTPGCLFFYETVKDSTIAFVPRHELVEFMLNDPARTQAMLDYFTTNYSASLIHVNALEQPKARDKLLHLLYFLCQRYGVSQFQKINIPFNLTHQNLASLVGLTRETTATEVGKLRKEGILTYDNQHYVVDLEKLLDLIGEDNLRGVNIGLKKTGGFSRR